MFHHSQQKMDQRPSGSMEGWSRVYDIITGLLFLGQEQNIRQSTLDLVKITGRDTILEVGCGTGTLTLAAKKRAGPESRVFGIDPAPDMIATAKQKAVKDGLEVEFKRGLIEAIPFSDDTFDIVLSSAMMHHVPAGETQRKGIEDVFRVLKPGGQFLIVDLEPPRTFPMKEIAGFLFGREFLTLSVGTFIPLLEKTGYIDIHSGATKSKAFSFLAGKRP